MILTTNTIIETPACGSIPQPVYVVRDWFFVIPEDIDLQDNVMLLTVCGVSVLGKWSGEVGEYFVAWSPIEKKVVH
jgi:hypothetical protein